MKLKKLFENNNKLPEEFTKHFKITGDYEQIQDGPLKGEWVFHGNLQMTNIGSNTAGGIIREIPIPIAKVEGTLGITGGDLVSFKNIPRESGKIKILACPITDASTQYTVQSNDIELQSLSGTKNLSGLNVNCKSFLINNCNELTTLDGIQGNIDRLTIKKLKSLTDDLSALPVRANSIVLSFAPIGNNMPSYANAKGLIKIILQNNVSNISITDMELIPDKKLLDIFKKHQGRGLKEILPFIRDLRLAGYASVANI